MLLWYLKGHVVKSCDLPVYQQVRQGAVTQKEEKVFEESEILYFLQAALAPRGDWSINMDVNGQCAVCSGFLKKNFNDSKPNRISNSMALYQPQLLNYDLR